MAQYTLGGGKMCLWIFGLYAYGATLYLSDGSAWLTANG